VAASLVVFLHPVTLALSRRLRVASKREAYHHNSTVITTTILGRGRVLELEAASRLGIHMWIMTKLALILY
jgi:hypothetical protein